LTPTRTLPVIVLGGSGYVAGELLRLLVGHPVFRVEAVFSESRGGERVTAAFPHLAGTAADDLVFAGSSGGEGTLAGVLGAFPSLGTFSALPHGDAARRIDALLTEAERRGCDARVVDLSADFRHRDPARYEAIYGRPHGAPARLAEFRCALPELEHDGTAAAAGPARHVAHPGCFTTAATLALAPLLAGDWIEPRATVVAVTGSTGAGRTPAATTHHPERRSDLFAYAPLAHRHEPEMRALLAACGGERGGGARDAGGQPGREREPAISFLPHSGPFARGIHATITARLKRPASATDVTESIASFYGGTSSSSSSGRPHPFVRVLTQPPRLQSVVGTNRCDLAVAVRGDDLVAFSALDNLVKGAAGGAVQWMNRLSGLADAAGLALPGLGWL
jgi:N-acetyl-gamma-glutamyl-phosphate reductase